MIDFTVSTTNTANHWLVLSTKRNPNDHLYAHYPRLHKRNGGATNKIETSDLLANLAIGNWKLLFVNKLHNM